MNLTSAQAAILAAGNGAVWFTPIRGMENALAWLVRNRLVRMFSAGLGSSRYAITSAGRAALKEWEKENATD
jgi:hypothetical protein